MKFQLHCHDQHARRGTLTLAHGTVETPAFMPVGTYGAVKGLSPDELQTLNAEIITGTRRNNCLDYIARWCRNFSASTYRKY